METCVVVTSGGCYWYPVRKGEGRCSAGVRDAARQGEGRCSASRDAPHSPHDKRASGPDVHGPEAEKPSARPWLKLNL